MAHDISGPPAGPSSSGHPDVASLSAADPPGAGQPPGAVETHLPLPVAEGPQPAPEPGKRRRLLYVTLPGCRGALVAGCLSFTPSLLPRGGVVQGLVWGITAAIGYGLGRLTGRRAARAAGGAGGRLDRGGRARLPGGHRPAAAGFVNVMNSAYPVRYTKTAADA